MNIKQTLISTLMLASSLSLFALEKEAPDPITSYGTSWIEVDGGTTIYSGSILGRSDTEFGASAVIKGNVHIIEIFRIGIDVGYTFAVDDLRYREDSVNIDTTAYTGELEAKAYMHLIKRENIGLTLFFSPFASYTYAEVDVHTDPQGPNEFRFHESTDGFGYGVKLGVEVSFLNDFYLAPAYRYLRLDPTASGISSADISIAELEFGLRLSRSVSMHLNYSHILEDNYEGIDISTDKVTVGVRYTF